MWRKNFDSEVSYNKNQEEGGAQLFYATLKRFDTIIVLRFL